MSKKKYALKYLRIRVTDRGSSICYKDWNTDKDDGKETFTVKLHKLKSSEDTFFCLAGPAYLFISLQILDDWLNINKIESDFINKLEDRKKITKTIYKIGKEIVASFKEFCKDYGRELQLWFEPGKYLVSNAGYLLVDTNVVKQTTSTVFAGVNSGQNHLLRPMMYDAYHHIVNISNPKGTERIYSVVGYICESDTFGYDRRLNEVRVGDVLAICNAGAYGFSMSSNYNSRLRPAEVMVYKGQAHIIRKREDLNYILQNQVEIELT